MGTRGLIGFRKKGRALRGVYNHWDSYPSNLGQAIVEFIRSLSPDQIKQMVKRLDALTWVNSHSARGCEGPECLMAILSGRVTILVDSADFLMDGLMCEWAYIMDFEEQTLEIWVGPIRHGSTCKKVREVKFSELTDNFMEGVAEEKYKVQQLVDGKESDETDEGEGEELEEDDEADDADEDEEKESEKKEDEEAEEARESEEKDGEGKKEEEE
jgi:hypothetical protein